MCIIYMHVGVLVKNEVCALRKAESKRFNALVEAMLKEVMPSQTEIDSSTRIANQIMGRLKESAPKDVEILLAGSTARGTQISGNSDIDIFLLFPKSVKKAELEAQGLRIAKGIIDRRKKERCEIKYAEHPYVRLLLEDKGVTVDVVPAYKITSAEERATAVDRTQLHNEFVNSNLTQKQRNCVRLLKAFFDGHGVYGAEAMTEGFSGYLCELLIYHYGSFLQAITAFANVKVPLVIEAKKRAELVGAPADALVKRFKSAFIVIDPTDSNRNVAANVSMESLARAALASRALLRNPNRGTFYRSGYSDIDAKARLSVLRKTLGASVYSIYFVVPDIAEDIIWQQLKKLSSRLVTELSSNGFVTMLSLQSLHNREALISLIIRDVVIKAEIAKGPSVFMGDAASRFVAARRNSHLISLDGERLYAIDTSRYTTPKALLRAFLARKGAELPSYLVKKRMRIYVNSMPERIAKLVYQAYNSRKINYRL
jgi:tRNA nucleotidyltransferase (CCA-adding enzyme)